MRNKYRVIYEDHFTWADCTLQVRFLWIWWNNGGSEGARRSKVREHAEFLANKHKCDLIER